jgi:secreted PhoX family phosphatase
MKYWLSLATVVALSTTFTACSSDDDDNDEVVNSSVKSLSFTEIETPTGDDKYSLQVASKVTVDGESQNINFTKIMATGQSDNGEMFGLLKDMNDNTLTMEDGSPYICNGTSNPSGSGSGLDYVSILQKNSKLYMVSQFECQIGGIYMNELEQDSSTGDLSVKSGTLQFVSQKSEFGGFVHCAGMKTPWESHLGSEEYPSDAKLLEDNGTLDTYYDFLVDYWNGNLTLSNPYYYGWSPEVSIDSDGKPVYTKHYSMGRMSHELSYVMPDSKTVYMSDDGTNVGLFMYVADTAEDLSAGTIYAAKWTQTSTTNGGTADISWIELGHATDSEIRAMLDPDGNVETNDGLKFEDILTLADANEDGSCPTGYSSINTSAYHECAKVNSGMEKAAAFFETRRYAAIKGATTEFRKEEGITFNSDKSVLYVAMSAVAYGMEDNMKKGSDETKYDMGGNNDIKLPYNPCGTVYGLDISADSTIGSDYVAKNMYGVVSGESIDEDANGNTCNLDMISNPDNVTFLEGSNTLVIGEDTGSHENNIVWAYDIETKDLQRVLATPRGAETTSPFWYRDINGFGYLTVVTQHPDTNTSDAGESSIGVIGNFKNLK